MAVAAATFVATGAAAQDQPSLDGVALVIGQSKYQHIPALPNPANDARDMVGLLSDLGFDARSVTDRDVAKLKRDLERFIEDAEGADVALLYYSGHGIESGGENWLIPVDADVSSLDNASENLVAFSEVMNRLKATVPVAIMLLDACRTNPFPEGALVRKDASDPGAPVGVSGLTPTRGVIALKAAPAVATGVDSLGTVIGFAAEPGRPALDGTAGENSPYASALLRHLSAMNGVEFGAVMRMVTEEVYLDTKTEQRPWVNESLRRLLYFGVAQDEPDGEDALITGERRQLLLTISELPDLNRKQVELVAAKDDVPLGALYGVLRALGEDKIPQDPNDLSKLLDAQAERLKQMVDRRAALRTDDPDIQRLTEAADRAIAEGAIVTAKLFLDDAVAKVEKNMSAVDAAEEEVKQKRIADAAVYAQRAATSMLAFDFLAAADDYRAAFDLIERWDDKLRWNYKNLEAEALQAYGQATGDAGALDRAIKAYETILTFLPPGDQSRDWAITRNNMAVVMHTFGELATDTKMLEEAAAIFEASLDVFVREKDDINWAAAQSNLGNILLAIGERDGDIAKIEQAIAAYRATLEKRDRAEVPLDWAASQNNLAMALAMLGERDAEMDRLREAEATYRAALEEYTREAAPVQWAMVQNNLGNVLNSLGHAVNDTVQLEAAIAAFRAAMEVRTKEQLPLQWASTQMNLGIALNNLGRLDLGTENIEAAAAAFAEALTVFTREKTPLEWASVQNNMGSVLQTFGQRSMDVEKFKEAVDAFTLAKRVYTRRAFPLDWAMTENNLGNTLQLMGNITSDPKVLKDAVTAYRNALREYDKDVSPRQWAFVQAGLGGTLQTLSTHEDMVPNLRASVEARRAALTVITFENAPVDWATAQNGLGMSLLNLSTFAGESKNLPDAKAAFEAAGKVFTREAQPLQWAFTQNNIGDVFWNLASSGGGKPDYEQAIAQFEMAKEGFSEAGQTMLIGLADQKIALIKDVLSKQ